MRGQFLIILASILILGLVGTMDDAYAETFTTIFDGPWDSAGTWEDSTGDNSIPGIADDKIVNHAIEMQVSENNFGQIQINGSLEIDDVIGNVTLTNFGNITINSGSSITIDSNSTIINKVEGTITINSLGEINNSGTIINDDSGTIRINSNGSIINSGTVTLKGGFFDNQGSFSGNQLELPTTINNSIMIDNGGTIIISSDTIIKSDSTLALGFGTIMHINPMINFQTSGGIIVNSLGEIRNSGVLFNFETITINSLGTITNTGEIRNFDTITINSGGNLINFGGTIDLLIESTITNSGMFNNNSNGFIVNFGGTFNNLGGAKVDEVTAGVDCDSIEVADFTCIGYST